MLFVSKYDVILIHTTVFTHLSETKSDEITNVVSYGVTIIGQNSNQEPKRPRDAIRCHLMPFDPISIRPCFTFVLLKSKGTKPLQLDSMVKQ